MFKKIVLLFFFIIIFNCHNNQNIGVYNMPENLINDLKILSNSKIYFGHQSVGSNIITGLEKILKTYEDSVLINIVQIDTLTELPEYYFAHSWIGQNTIPSSKCKDFSYILSSNALNNVDIAMFKFCYVDISKETDVNQLFELYKNTMDSLRSNYPNVKFIHITTPLKSNIFNWKTPIKKLLGREIDVKPANIKRNLFNELLLEYYKNESIFDLAKIESTLPEGSREIFMIGGKSYYSLVPAYTDDGGHLNTVGSTIVAREFIKVISDALRQRGNYIIN